MLRVPMIFISSFKYPVFNQSKRTLAIVLPGLEPFEQNYVDKQVSIIVNHKYKSADEEKELLKQYINEDSILRYGTKNNLLLVKRICSLLEDQRISNPDNIAKCVRAANYAAKSFYTIRAGKKSSYRNPAFNKATSFLLKQEKGVKVLPDMVKILETGNKSHPGSKKTALIPVKSIYLNEELNFETFKEELKELKLAEVKDFEKVDLFRNLYIITKLFGLSISDAIQESENSIINIDDFCTQLKSTNALEVLIQLNVYEQLLLQDVDSLNDKKKFLENLIFTVFYHIAESSQLLRWDLSLVLYYSQLLNALGFGENTIRYLFLTKHIVIIACVQKMHVRLQRDFKGDFQSAEECLVERNSLMELTERLTCPHSVTEQILALFTKSQGSIFSLDRRIFNKTSFKTMICNKFGETAYKKLIRAIAFTDRQKSIRFELQVMFNLNFVECFGFSEEQISRGIQVLAYPAASLESIIKDIDSEPENYSGLSSTLEWKSDPKALQIVSYYLEISEGLKSNDAVHNNRYRKSKI